MCFFNSGKVQSGPPMQMVTVNAPDGVRQAMVEQGIPQEYIDRGAATVTQYQQMAAQDLSDRQIQAQREVGDKQQAFNEEQVRHQQEQYDQQQRQVQEQAGRQSTYDTGRAQALDEATGKVNAAFARFSPEYFKKYTADFLGKAQDQIDYQRNQATKDLGFQLARQGLASSQAGVNQRGLIAETSGRATAEQADKAQQAMFGLQTDVANARQNLTNQIIQAQSIGSPIAGNTIEDVNSALQTQRSAISPLATSAGDVASNLQAVPTVNTLSNIFAGILGSGANFLGGINQGSGSTGFNRGLAGKGFGTGSTTTRTT